MVRLQLNMQVNETDRNHQNLKWQYQVTLCTDAKKKLDINKKQNLKFRGMRARWVVVEGSQFKAEKFHSLAVVYSEQCKILNYLLQISCFRITFVGM